MKLMSDLKAIPGAVEYDSDSAAQVVFFLKDGKTLRICYGEQGLTVDQYAGLAIGASGKTDLGQITPDFTEEEAAAECRYRFEERLAILCEDKEPIPEQIAIAKKEAGDAMLALGVPVPQVNKPKQRRTY